MRPFHQRLGLSAPIVACSGALLWNVQAAAGLAHVSVEPGLATQIVALGRELGAFVNVESDDEWFADRPGDLEREGVLNYEISEPHSIGNVDEMLRAGEPIDKVFLDLRDLEEDVAATAKVTVQRVFENQANIYETTPGVIDITARDASKAAMAQQLARRMQIPADQTMAIGDDDSDAALLRWAGMGVAMGNATPAAKAASDVITSSNLRDGVAEALEHWILGKKATGAPASVPNPSLVTY
jgi:Cof subfamily protein (haloacid dehalogenase superfamily)